MGDLILYFASFIGFYSILCLIRNQLVFNFRTSLIGLHWDLLHSLPSYESMVANPKYWLLWTNGQWTEWAKRNAIGADEVIP